MDRRFRPSLILKSGIVAFAFVCCLLLLPGCADENAAQAPTEETTATETVATDAQDADQTDSDMKLQIGDTEIPVSWEKNTSVSELKSLVENEPITIQMSMYSDFEQVGPIGQNITSDDKQMTTKAGDIILYSGNQIVIFYGSNSWDYTMLGHVELTEAELTDLLGNGDVEMTIY